MQLQPYVHFNGQCEEAIEFYKKAVGAQVNMLMRFKDMPASCGPSPITPGTENKVMHANLRIGDSVVLVSDGQCTGVTKFDGFSLTLTASSDAEAEKTFNALADGGAVRMPLQKTFFSSKFGMVNDRFGVPWMVIVG
jgi:PhnB protein